MSVGSIVLMVIGIIVGIWCLISNIYVVAMMTAEQMHSEFIDGQCLVGKIFANLFYSPAWFFKGVRFVAVKVIK